MSTGKGNLRPAREYTRELHLTRQRNGKTPLPDEDLDRELTLYWLNTIPGYRKVIRERVSKARRRQMELDRRLLKHLREDTDQLGREVEGCG